MMVWRFRENVLEHRGKWQQVTDPQHLPGAWRNLGGRKKRVCVYMCMVGVHIMPRQLYFNSFGPRLSFREKLGLRLFHRVYCISSHSAPLIGRVIFIACQSSVKSLDCRVQCACGWQAYALSQWQYVQCILLHLQQQFTFSGYKVIVAYIIYDET